MQSVCARIRTSLRCTTTFNRRFLRARLREGAGLYFTITVIDWLLLVAVPMVRTTGCAPATRPAGRSRIDLEQTTDGVRRLSRVGDGGSRFTSDGDRHSGYRLGKKRRSAGDASRGTSWNDRAFAGGENSE